MAHGRIPLLEGVLRGLSAKVARCLAELGVSSNTVLRMVVVKVMQITLRHWLYWNHLRLCDALLASDGLAADVEVCHLSIHVLA